MEKPSIELCPMKDDPKLWSDGKKVNTFLVVFANLRPCAHQIFPPGKRSHQLRIFLLVGGASIMPMLSQSIYNPVLVDIQEHFGASYVKMGLTVSLPILWVDFGLGLWSAFEPERLVRVGIDSKACAPSSGRLLQR
jgi:hypothetical protein